MLHFPRRYQIAAIALCIGIFCFHLFTLHRGTSWGDDWTMYVNHALNLAQGRPYTFPGYIFNPMYPDYAPTAYPAGYPLLLAPVVGIWGLNLTALKIVNLLCLAGGLYLTWYWLQSRLSPVSALVIPLMIGVAPYFWDMRDNLLSDIPHMAFSVLFFVLLDRWQKRGDWKTAVWLGLILFFVYALRSIGLVLFGAFGLQLIFGPASLRKTGGIALALAIGLLVLHNILVPSDSYYHMVMGQKFRIVDRLYDGLRPYVSDFGAFVRIFDNNDLLVLGKFVSVLFPTMMLAGFLRVGRWTILETYCGAYILAITFFPGYQGFRYLVGIIPFLLFYAASFVEGLPLKRVRYTAAIFLLLIFFGHSVQWYRQNMDKPMSGDILEENAQNFMAFIRDSIPKDAVIIADRPRVIALYAQRRGTVYPDYVYEEKWLDWLNENNVTYAMKAAWDNDKPNRYWARYIDAHPDQFTKIFEDRGLQVYRYHPPPPQ